VWPAATCEPEAIWVKNGSINPSITRTPMTQARIVKGADGRDTHPLAGIPLGRLAEAEEIAQAALFLLSGPGRISTATRSSWTAARARTDQQSRNHGARSRSYPPEVKHDRSLRYLRSGHTSARGVLRDPIPGLLKALIRAVSDQTLAGPLRVVGMDHEHRDQTVLAASLVKMCGPLERRRLRCQ
jgi:hypothetical protein